MAKLAALSLALAVCLLAQSSEACIYKFGTSKDSLVSRGSRLWLQRWGGQKPM